MVQEVVMNEAFAVSGHLLLIASVVLGVLLHARFLWPYRMFMASIVVLLTAVSMGFLLPTEEIGLLLLILLLIQGYRTFGLLRIVKGRQKADALRFRSRRTELVLGSLAVLCGIGLHLEVFELVELPWLLLLASVQVVISAVFWLHSKTSSEETEPNSQIPAFADVDLPSLTVAIPARDENDELHGCIQSVLRSNYPKLEVLVLDDCSHDNTPDIIKGFAHKGVRFIKGRIAPTSWLAKNYAYQTLLDEAGGQYVLFCGTDTRFQTNSLRRMVEQLMSDDADMLSVLPLRPARLDASYVLQAMRYWRELAFPRFGNKGVPPVLSTCWLARRKFLVETGGFAAYKKAIRPERQLALKAARENRYRFMRSVAELSVVSVKGLRGQWNTALRTRYPELKSAPERVFASSLLYGAVLLGSPVLAASAWWAGLDVVAFLSALATVFLLATHLRINIMIDGGHSIVKTILYPLHVAFEIVALNVSMYSYEFSEVVWKGRNICQPVLEVSKRLPKT